MSFGVGEAVPAESLAHADLLATAGCEWSVNVQLSANVADRAQPDEPSAGCESSGLFPQDAQCYCALRKKYPRLLGIALAQETAKAHHTVVEMISAATCLAVPRDQACMTAMATRTPTMNVGVAAEPLGCRRGAGV